ncbi:hypothetical protein E2P81_ATG09316 [Venturia nashicola]|uniref:Uncharacterized protein n=1 Tax=Venturia nashicola TaxID=86259 RepID=A0A4Z1NZJ5_9PEZI|nr:hypothetical protein E6O75_ATG09523 [Venturia nashicola]TLD25659.1 hypothetical protein E2P81_ATG09316 [Venturia nashicola]
MSAKQYDETVVVALIMALKAKGGTTSEALKDMTSLDANRSLSSFEHQLRAANRLATTLNEKKSRGEALGPADVGGGSGGGGNGRKRGAAAGGSVSSTPVKRARGGKTKKEESEVKDEVE